ncbi:DL-endopeptidase inhibitor IseA family protein [Clostridium sp.]|uniref:DL-endopeptidase inhibitor IseA family protein n=1 Tax=Clostridium sp. TaxID=1506 RepID=UPI003D6D52E7
MYRCSKCEHRMDDGDIFCPECGYRHKEKTPKILNKVNSFKSPEKIKKRSNKLLKVTIILVLLFFGVFMIWNTVISDDFKNFISEALPMEMAAESAENSIVGSWVGTAEDGSIAYIDFEKEKFKMVYPDSQRSMSGIYIIVDSDTLSIYPLVVDGEKTEGRTELRHKFHFQDDNTLVLNLDGNKLILTKGNYNINNSKKELEKQQTTTENVEQIYPVEESVWTPSANVNPDAESTGSESNSSQKTMNYTPISNEDILILIANAYKADSDILHCKQEGRQFGTTNGRGYTELKQEFNSYEKINDYLEKFWEESHTDLFINTYNIKSIEGVYCAPIGDGSNPDYSHGNVINVVDNGNKKNLIIEANEDGNIYKFNHTIIFENGKWVLMHNEEGGL